jgi:hypothetical protein
MESIWTEFTALDPWETYVVTKRLLFAEVDHSSFHSRRGEECPMVRQPFYSFFLRTDDVGQFHNHPRDRGHAEFWTCIPRILLPRFQGG